MIIVQLSGDLGNQMFQYAFGRRLALIHQTPLKLDISEFERTPDSYRLDRFKIQAVVAATKDVSQLINLHHLRDGNSTIDPALFVRTTNIEKSPYLVSVRDNTYLTGQCRTLHYFEKIAPYLRQELRVKMPPKPPQKKLLKQIAKQHAVAIYLHQKQTDEASLANLSLDYYYRAAETIANQISHPVFYVFSNAVDWCKKNFSINYPHYFLEDAQIINQFETFRLMRGCKHHIIANTTLSWWAAWLGSEKKKIVIAPEQWFDNDQNAADFLPQCWLRCAN